MAEEADITRGSATMPLEKFESQLESYLFMKDRVLDRQILSSSKHKNAYPYFSHTNQVSNVDKKQVELLSLQIECSNIINNMFTSEDEFDEGDWLFSEGLMVKSVLDINKARNGWFFQEVKKRGREIRMEEVEPERRGILGFRRRKK